jgi:hypothetical protein
MRELIVSAPYEDPHSQRRTRDWLVAVLAGALVEIHRFNDRDAAAEFGQELIDHPGLDTDDRDVDARREAAAERNHL